VTIVICYEAAHIFFGIMIMMQVLNSDRHETVGIKSDAWP